MLWEKGGITLISTRWNHVSKFNVWIPINQTKYNKKPCKPNQIQIRNLVNQTKYNKKSCKPNQMKLETL